MVEDLDAAKRRETFSKMMKDKLAAVEAEKNSVQQKLDGARADYAKLEKTHNELKKLCNDLQRKNDDLKREKDELNEKRLKLSGK